MANTRAIQGQMVNLVIMAAPLATILTSAVMSARVRASPSEFAQGGDGGGEGTNRARWCRSSRTRTCTVSRGLACEVHSGRTGGASLAFLAVSG